MDLVMLLNKQKELDREIFKNAGLGGYPFKSIQLALLVELGELANEWKGFKYWKKEKRIDREKLLDEFADCLHFALSLENYNKQFSRLGLISFGEKFEELYKESKEIRNDINEAFMKTYNCVLNNNMPIAGVISLGSCLEITPDEMQAAYLKKNEENYKRQREGY